jgi:hypothetical protein
MKKTTQIELSFYPMIRCGHNLYAPSLAKESAIDGDEVLFAEPPSNEAMDGLRIAVFDDKWIPDNKEIAEPTGLQQVHIMGTPEAFRAFGTYLIAISEENSSEDRVDHIEPVKGAGNKNQVHLVVHSKFRAQFGETIRSGSLLSIGDGE